MPNELIIGSKLSNGASSIFGVFPVLNELIEDNPLMLDLLECNKYLSLAHLLTINLCFEQTKFKDPSENEAQCLFL